MKQLVLYGNGGARNHGNEAILRGFSNLFPKHKKILYSFNSDTDYKWHLNELYDIKDQRAVIVGFTFSHIRNYIMRHLHLNKTENHIRFKPFISKINSKSIYLLIAGDQYCEPKENGIREWYEYINKKIHKKGAKSVMLFCTIPEKSLGDQSLIKDLNRYDLIIARENITYNALKSKKIQSKIIFSPCCAFLMQPKETILPDIFHQSNVIGITVGELAQNKESYSERLFKSTLSLIEYILNNTDFNVALIPHVQGSVPDDIRTCNKIQKSFKSERVINVGENRADVQKYIISKCDSVITVRTHVSIAAYSCCVPTVVVGYSQKSIGIARDLFGTDKNYVINIETACKTNGLIDSFVWLQNNKTDIKKTLQRKLPNYLSNLEGAYSEIMRLLDG